MKNQNLCLDKGYDYPEIERESIERRYVPHIRHRGVEKELIKIGYYSAKRWVVERTNSWHDRFRKLLEDMKRNQLIIWHWYNSHVA